MVMKRHRDLDQTLQKQLFWRRSSPPDIFEYFMGLEECSLVEQIDSLVI